MPETHPENTIRRKKEVMNFSHFVCCMSLLTFLGLKNAAAIEIGADAPAITAIDEGGQALHFADYYSKGVTLVYFYPKADTPGCTTQACGVRDRAGDYARANAVVLGISPDKVAALRRFADKYGLAFTLLADVDHAVAESYGVWVEKSRYGRTYWGNSRTTFIIDADGIVRHVIAKVTPATHDDDALAALRAL